MSVVSCTFGLTCSHFSLLLLDLISPSWRPAAAAGDGAAAAAARAAAEAPGSADQTPAAGSELTPEDEAPGPRAAGRAAAGHEHSAAAARTGN